MVNGETKANHSTKAINGLSWKVVGELYFYDFKEFAGGIYYWFSKLNIV